LYTSAMNERPYHHGDLRRALIDAAIDLVEERGHHALSLREAARRVGVSPGAPYRHFPNKRALLVAVATELNERHSAMVQEVAAELEPGLLSAFRAHALAGARIATRHPQLYRLMTSPETMAVAAEAWTDVAQAQREGMLDLLRQAQQAGELAPGPVEPMLLAGQAISNGLLRMVVDGQLCMMGIDSEGRIEELMMAVTEVLADGLRPRGS